MSGSGTVPALAGPALVMGELSVGAYVNQPQQSRAPHCLHSIRNLKFVVDSHKVEIHRALTADQDGGNFPRRFSFQDKAQDLDLALGESHDALFLNAFSQFGCHFPTPFGFHTQDVAEETTSRLLKARSAANMPIVRGRTGRTQLETR